MSETTDAARAGLWMLSPSPTLQGQAEGFADGDSVAEILQLARGIRKDRASGSVKETEIGRIISRVPDLWNLCSPEGQTQILLNKINRALA